MACARLRERFSLNDARPSMDDTPTMETCVMVSTLMIESTCTERRFNWGDVTIKSPSISNGCTKRIARESGPQAVLAGAACGDPFNAVVVIKTEKIVNIMVLMSGLYIYIKYYHSRSLQGVNFKIFGLLKVER